ncbi:hypothetical protein ES708_17311 [subsurface metagenome]
MFYKSFAVTGFVNVTTFDDGLISSIEEPKKIRAILISVSKYRGNILEGWIETNRILEIYDFVLNTYDYSAQPSSFIRIPIDEVIKPGMIFKIAINCGSIQSNIHGAYEYELTT